MSNKKTTWIECRNTAQQGVIGFYLLTSGNEYFLCSQKFRKGIWRFFQNGVRYEMAIDFSKAKKDHSVMNAMKRIRTCIDYLEKHERVLIPERCKNNCTRLKEAM